TPNLRARIASAGKAGPAGPQGSVGPAGQTGATGPEGKRPTGDLLTYSSPGGDGAPLVLSREDGTSQDSVGPLTFTASCVAEGEDTIRGKLEVTSSENGV